MLVYIIIGLVIIGYCCVQEFRTGELTVESLRDPIFWISNAAFVIVWPILIASAFYEIAKVLSR